MRRNALSAPAVRRTADPTILAAANRRSGRLTETHPPGRLGALATKSRSRSSGARPAAGSAIVVITFLARTAPVMPSSRIGAERAGDLTSRVPARHRANRCWVADFTHVAAWSGVVYVAFVVDTFSRRIVGWSASTSKGTQLILDALEMALWQRDREDCPHTPGQLIHHSDAGSSTRRSSSPNTSTRTASQTRTATEEGDFGIVE